MGRNNLAELFAELKFTKGAEIGVENGLYSEILCKANPNLHLFCIDPWKAAAYEPGVDGVDEQANFNQRYKAAKERLAPYRCTIVRKTSMAALKDFADETLDFVYIDGNHDFVNFVNDLHYWRKKVRQGGIVAGHDFATYPFRKYNHVKRALEAYVASYRMIPVFVVGSFAYQEGFIRDKYRSWFWVKT